MEIIEWVLEHPSYRVDVEKPEILNFGKEVVITMTKFDEVPKRLRLVWDISDGDVLKRLLDEMLKQIDEYDD